jgi:hypothetical protein
MAGFGWPPRAAKILARDLIIQQHHVRQELREPGAIPLIGAARELLQLLAHQPAQIVRIAQRRRARLSKAHPVRTGTHGLSSLHAVYPLGRRHQRVIPAPKAPTPALCPAT